VSRPAFAAALLLGCAADPAPPAAGPQPLRVGWQTTWATQGQLACALMAGDHLQAQGFAPSFHGFPYGAPLNEAALAGEVDVVLTADQPALTLHARDPAWGIDARLMTNRVGGVVPQDGPVAQLADLRGRTLVVPFGAAAHRAALGALRGAGLQPGVDVQVQNLGLDEIQALMAAGPADGAWGAAQAAAAWDPALASWELSGSTRTLFTEEVTAVVLSHARLADGAAPGSPAPGERLRAALDAAWRALQADPGPAEACFLAQSGLPIGPEVLTRAAAVEPNLRPGQAPRVRLSPAEVDGLQAAADFLHTSGLVPRPLQARDALRPGAAE
jgi:ABC-type nitrate/sulfonate/bicarbonate transport system substrate-binding protein